MLKLVSVLFPIDSHRETRLVVANIARDFRGFEFPDELSSMALASSSVPEAASEFCIVCTQSFNAPQLICPGFSRRTTTRQAIQL
jgi:hypothetical protein